jgi:hypothetical protein
LPSPTVKKFFRVAAISAAGLVLLLLLANWLFLANARRLIQAFVESETHGKVHVDFGRLRIRYFHPPQIEATDLRLGLMDSSGSHEVYTVRTQRLFLQLRSLRSLLLQQKFLVDDILAESPSFEVYPQYKQKRQEGNNAIVFELGNVYKVLDTLSRKLEVRNIRITRGNFSIDKFQPGNQPARITDIGFRLENFRSPEQGGGGGTKFLYSDAISISSGRLELMFPDGRHGLTYTGLNISTRDRSITVDSCNFFSTEKDSSFNAANLYFDRLKFINLDFQALYHAEKIKVDTVLCLNPTVQLRLDITRKETATRQGLDSLMFHGTMEVKEARKKKAGTRGSYTPVNALSNLLGHLDIGFIDLQNSQISLTTKNHDKLSPFTTRGNNFQVGGLQTGLEGDQPIAVKKVAFAIRNYRAYSSDSLYEVLFDSVVYDNRNLYLKNFALEPSAKNRGRDIKKVSIPVLELKNLSLNEIIGRQRLQADELILMNPLTLNYHHDEAQSLQGKGRPLRAVITEVNKKVSIGKVTMVNGYFLSQSLETPSRKMAFGGINSSIDTRELLHAPNYILMGHSIGNLDFQNGVVSTERFRLTFGKGKVDGRDQLIRAETIEVATANGSLKANLQGARIKGYQFDNELRAISVDSLSWESGEFHFSKSADAKSGKARRPFPSWKLQSLDLRNTSLDIDLGSTAISGRIDSMLLTGLHSSEKGNPEFSGLNLVMRSLLVNRPGLAVTASRIRMNEDAPSTLEQVRIGYGHSGDTADVFLPTVRFHPHIGLLMKDGSVKLDELVLDQPRIRAQLTRKGMDTSQVNERKPLAAEIGLLNIRNGDIGIRTARQGNTMEVMANGLNLDIRDIRAGEGNDRFSAGAFHESLSSFSLNHNDSLRVYTESGSLELSGQRIVLGKKDVSRKGSLILDRARITGLHTALQRPKAGKPLEFRQVAMGIDDLVLDNLDKATIARKLKANPGLYIRNIDFVDRNDKHEMAAYGIRFENRDHLLALDSFRYRPAMDADSFNRMQPWQKDYLQASTGALAIRGIDIEKLVADTVFSAEKMTVDRPVLNIFKDKRLPFQHGIIKNLPTDMLTGKLAFGIRLDSLRLRDALVQYSEFNDKTSSMAEISLHHIDALLTGIRNRDIAPTDSLRLVAYGRFLDTTAFRFQFRESYTDSLHGFLMSLRVSPVSLTALNSFLPQIASARISSGFMDTLRLLAIGREYLAHGQMQLYYHDLKIQYLDKGDELHKTFITKLVTFFANNLILRKNNKNRNGTIFFERIRERSVVNYWIKILLSGALTSAGVKENKKQDRKYAKKLKKLNVPEIPDVDF